MANIRQYIGARYVFKIYENSQDPSSAEWESGVTYEPLTIVTYLNSTYASKKDVPGSVGNPASNPTYWVVTGAYNGQIATLQQQIDTLNNTTIPSIEAAIQALDDASVTFDKIGFNINKYHNVICIADSWGGTNGWCDKLNSMGFSDGTFQEVAHGGTGFQTGDPTFEQSINALTPLVDADKVDCIVIIGGTNDQTNLGTLPTAIGSCVSAAKTRFPNATVYVGFNLHYIVGFGQIDATEVNGSLEVIKNGGIPLTGLSFNQRFNKWDWLSDNWHLSDYTFFAEMIYSGIYCGTIDIPRAHVEEDLGITSTNIRSVKANYHNGYCYLTIALNSGITYTTLAHIISANEIPLLNLHGRSNRVLKAATGGDTLDLIIEDGVVDTFIGGTIGNYPITFNVISHHGVICN